MFSYNVERGELQLHHRQLTMEFNRTRQDTKLISSIKVGGISVSTQTCEQLLKPK